MRASRGTASDNIHNPLKKGCLMMTRKHYIVQARILSEWREKFYPLDDEFQCLVDDFCRYFKRDNYRFDPTRFKEACGIV